MNQFPAECNYAQPDISIPYERLDLNQAGLRSWTEEGILWESSSPLELPLFRECLQISCESLLSNALWGCTPGNPGPEGAQSCLWHLTAHPSPPKELAVHLHAHPATAQQLRPPEHRQPHRGAGAATVSRTNKENSSRKAERALQMRRKLMTNKQQKWLQWEGKAKHGVNQRKISEHNLLFFKVFK